jgi:hypothetical protein
MAKRKKNKSMVAGGMNLFQPSLQPNQRHIKISQKKTLEKE